MPASQQVLSVGQMRRAEESLIEAGSSVEALMEEAGQGAAEWIWRIAGRERVTVLCGPGNNGGDGYVIARRLRERGGAVQVVAAYEPKTAAARKARSLFDGPVLGREAQVQGEVFVDCLFGSGLSRPLVAEDTAMIAQMAAAHRLSVAVDVPSGVDADTGAMRDTMPCFDLTLALGAWKHAHVLMPACAQMGMLRLVDIGVRPVIGAAQRIEAPKLHGPAADAHKYDRGLVAIVGGAMPGAAILAAIAAQGAGAGYVRLLSDTATGMPHDIVHVSGSLAEGLNDERIGAVLVGPGLGRDDAASERLALTLLAGKPTVVDADALMILKPAHLREHPAPIIATPHGGELVALERAFECTGTGSKIDRATALAKASGVIVVAKGPDTIVAAPDGRVACSSRATSWLSTAGTGDVLAGTIASRLATGADAFDAACHGVWLHAEAARLCPPAFTAGTLAHALPRALETCL